MRRLILLLPAGLFCLQLCAQTTPPAPPAKQNKDHRFYAGFSLAFGLPQAEFRDNLNSIGIGIDGMFAWQPSHRFPVALGFDVGYMAYAMHTQRQTLYAEVKSGNTVISTLEIPLRVETASSIVDPQVLLRFIAPTKKVVPFVDAIFGFTYFRTGTSIYDESSRRQLSSAEDGLITRDTNLDDWTMNYGCALGLQYELKPTLAIHVRCAYIFGGEAQYYSGKQAESWDINLTTTPTDPNNISANELDVNATPYESRTDMINIKAGVTLKFD
ncbi:MAG TPA: hypothetical protein PLW54_04980 [Bacteroidia bacterium]|nr:hypothetical protein [Bacteroidia bacterium]